MKWTLEALHCPAFELPDAARFVDRLAMGDKMPDAAVKNWTARGFLHPIMGKRGKKDVRQYSAADLFRIHFASRLIYQHTSVTAAFIAAGRGVEHIESMIKTGSFATTPAEEHWITFEDHDELSTVHYGNDVVNFWIMKSIVIDGNVYSPKIGEGLDGPDFCVKHEQINLDRSIKYFFKAFFKACLNEDFAYRLTRATFLYGTAKTNTQFDLCMENLEAEVQNQPTQD